MNWEKVKRDHIIAAIDTFEMSSENYPHARNTFLKYKNIKYPAKHLRRIAYKVATGKEISQEDFAGGKETVDFFTKRGFSVEYKGKIYEGTYKEQTKKEPGNNTSDIHKRKRGRSDKRLNPIKQNKSNGYKIGRLVFTNKKLSNSFDRQIIKSIKDFEDVKVKLLITQGGFLKYQLPNKYRSISIGELESRYLKDLYSLANDKVIDFIDHIPKSAFNILNKNVNYFSIGVDFGVIDIYDEMSMDKPHIELVALYDFKQKKVINLTGKFYPTNDQQKHLIKVKDFDSKFIQLGDDKVLILGCHDLSIFNPRGQANLGSGSYKAEISKEFYKRFEQEKPNVIIQHPHVTTLKRTWLNAWKNIEKKYPFVTHYASGIYAPLDPDEKPDFVGVLNSTKKGNVIDVIVKTNHLFNNSFLQRLKSFFLAFNA